MTRFITRCSPMRARRSTAVIIPISNLFTGSAHKRRLFFMSGIRSVLIYMRTNISGFIPARLRPGVGGAVYRDGVWSVAPKRGGKLLLQFGFDAWKRAKRIFAFI